MTKDWIETQIKKFLKKNKITSSVEITHPENLEFGDYTTNIALQISRILKENPINIAKKIVESIPKNKEIKEINIIKPGFINFYLHDDVLYENLLKVIVKKEKYGTFDEGRGKIAIVDYSSPNIAKRFNIGHLRSTIIGQSIYNLYKYLGWKVIGDNHLGDWGTQFGKMIVAIEKWADKPVNQLSVDELEKLYVKFHEEAEKDKSLDELARKKFKNLEEGEYQETKVWKTIVTTSLKNFQKIYNLLNVHINFAYGESFYQDKMDAVIEEIKSKNLAKKSKGALIVEFSDKNMPPGILIKSDGATTYLTRDLATIKFRREKWHPGMIIHEVGIDQTLYFKQVFKICEMLGWTDTKYIHVKHGLIRLKGGKMSTRKGRNIKLEQILEEAVKMAKKINPDKKIAEAVGIGAVKYNDLKRSPSSDYVFNWQEALNLEGNSGPYLQYTYVRTQSVLEKSKDSLSQSKSLNQSLNKDELYLTRMIQQFPNTIKQAGYKFSPNLLTNYLFKLAHQYNLFYQKYPILKSNKDTRKIRLVLTKATGQVIKNGLEILGIKTVSKM